MTDYARYLGRIEERKLEQERFLLRALVPAAPPARRARTWGLPYLRDQGRTRECKRDGPCGTCVGHAWHHLLGAGPYRQKNARGPLGIYHRAQDAHDPWPGRWPQYDGTSVDAGGQALLEWGLIHSFHWAWTVEEGAAFVIERGPLVAGTDWTSGMFDPDAQGIIRPTGRTVGGHAYLIYGADLDRATFRLANSWGHAWGARGTATLSFEDMATLLARGGELCAAVEDRPPPGAAP